MSEGMHDGEFSVVMFFPDDHYVYWLRNVDAETAVRCAKRQTEKPAADLGVIRRVIITDGDDCTVFEWKHGEGVTFPPRDRSPDTARNEARSATSASHTDDAAQ